MFRSSRPLHPLRTVAHPAKVCQTRRCGLRMYRPSLAKADSLPPRPTRRLFTPAAGAGAGAAGPAPSRPLLIRFLHFYLRAFSWTVLGFVIAVVPAIPSIKGFLKPISDEESRDAWSPTDPETKALEDRLNDIPLVQSLRADPSFVEFRPHLQMPPVWAVHNLTCGTLRGPGMVPIPPLAFMDKAGDKKHFIQLAYLGQDLCGHAGFVHGGFLATMLDEGLGKPALQVLPSGIGLTANLKVNYKAPCEADQFVVLRAEVSEVDGHKVRVVGRIETCDAVPVEVANATALYIEPKIARLSQASRLARLLVPT